MLWLLLAIGRIGCKPLDEKFEGKGRDKRVPTRDRSILPGSDHSGSTESKSETLEAHHAAVYSLSDWYTISSRSTHA